METTKRVTTVGDLVAALSKYPAGTPIIGGAMTGEISSAFSIQEAYEDKNPKQGDGDSIVEPVLLNVSLHVWPDHIAKDGNIMGLVEQATESFPRIVPMDSIPANANPFTHDFYHMGCEVCGPWMAMYSGHCGLKAEINKTAEEKASPEPVWYSDPKYIILVNQRTGQRFRLVWDAVAQDDKCEFMQNLLLERELV